MSEPSVSVIIPSRNRPDEVRSALTSVYRQTLPPMEVIVVDDGSSEKLSDIIQKDFPGVIVLRNDTSRGGAAARNQGAAVAKGNYLAFLDSDDEWMPEHLLHSVEFISANNADGTFGAFVLNRNGTRIPVPFFSDTFPKGQLGNYIFSFRRFDARTSTFVFKREPFLAVRFDDQLKKHQDWDLAIHFDQQFRFLLNPEPTVQINVASDKDRMSHNFNHEATFYFLNRIQKYVSANYRFDFCLKMIMRCQRKGEPWSVIKPYIHYIAGFQTELSPRNRMVYLLLKYRLLNLSLVYKIRQRLTAKG